MATKSLFEITKERQETDEILTELLALEEQSEYDIQRAEELMNKLEIGEHELEAKALAYIHVIHEIEAQNELAKREVKRLKDRLKKNEKTIESLSGRILYALDAFNLQKFTAGTYTISARKSKSLEITDINGVPQEYSVKKEEVSVDKMAIKKRLQDLEARVDSLSQDEAEELEVLLGFAKIQENKSLSVR